MSYCAPLGIPLSVFRSWPAKDRKWALAWRHDQDSKLPCGCYPDETVGDEHDDVFAVERVVCERHRAIGDAAEHYNRHADKTVPRHGVYWVTRRVD